MDVSGIYPVSLEQKASFEARGFVVLPEVAAVDEVSFYRNAIGKAVRKFNREKRRLSERDTYGKAFLQVTNLWERDELVKKFVFANKFAQIAADLLAVNKVRLYHDQALFKEPKGGRTPWHQDQFYWNLDTEKTITMWMPLVDVSAEMGTMRFAAASHKNGLIENVSISDESDEIFNKYIADRGLEIFQPKLMKAGDATFHSGMLVHSACENSTDQLREVMTIIYFADQTRVSKPINKYQEIDHRVWLDSIPPGEMACGNLNPIINI